MLAKSYRHNLFLKNSVKCFSANIYEKTFMSKDLVIIPSKTLKQKPSADHVYAFGGITTDHMLEIDYDRDNGGW